MTPLEDRSSKHTAGPLSIREDGQLDGETGLWCVVLAAEPHVFTASYCRKADATLYAAAPALLEALRKVHMSAVIIPGVPTEAALSVNVLKEVEAALRLATEPTNER